MFAEKEKFSITSNELAVSSRSILLLLELKNETNNIIDVTKMTIRIVHNRQELVVSKSYLYNNNKKIKNKLCIDKENQLSIAAYSKRLEWVCFDIDDKLFEIISKNKDIKIYLNIKDDKSLNIDVDIKA